MRTKLLHYSFLLTTLIFTWVVFNSRSTGAANAGIGGRTGAPTEGLCSNCHSGGAFGTVTVTTQLTPVGGGAAITTYTPGTTYQVTVQVSGTSAATRYAFQTTAVNASNTFTGSFNTAGAGVQFSAASGRTYAEHTTPSTTNSFQFRWTAPMAGTGTVRFFSSGICANNSGNTNGDNAGNSSISIPETAPPLSASMSASPSTVCPGASSTLTVTPTGGATPYQYNFGSGNQAGNTRVVNPTMTTAYTVTVTDNMGATSTANTTVTVNTPPTPTINAGVTSLCPGATTTLSTTSNYSSYRWSTGATTANIAVGAGSYTVTVTAANGCTGVSAARVINSNSGVTITNSTVTNVRCFGGSTGMLTTTSTSGANMGYIWSNGETTSYNFNIPVGVYTITVTNTQGCTASQSFTVTQPSAPLAASASWRNITCVATTGSATVTASGGTPGYSYVWSNGQSSASATGLSFGNHTVTVTDANNCSTTSFALVGQVTSNLTATPSVSNIACFGNSTGGINLTVAGGTAPFDYLWSNGSTTQNITGLTAGNYSCTITDADGCTFSTGNTTVTQPSAALSLGGLPTISQVSCFGLCDGSVSNVNMIGGTTPFTYSWSNGATSANLSGICAGLYTGTVTDANGCTYTPPIPLQITEPTQLTVTAQSNGGVSCPGATNGEVNANASGGTAPYLFDLGSGAQGMGSFNGLSAGIYTVTVSDANGCEMASTAVTIMNPMPPIVTATIVDESIQSTTNNGSITLALAGGTPIAFAWGNGGTSNPLTGLATGAYSVTVTYDQNCTLTQTFNVGFDAGVSVDNLGKLGEVRVFPNPMTDEIVIDASQLEVGLGELNASLYNTNGQLLIENRSLPLDGSAKIDVSALPIGVYILMLSKESHIRMVRIVKM